MIRSGEEIIGAIIGPSKCGKTTLALALCRKMWVRHGLRSLVFDPWFPKNKWGNTAWVTTDLEQFERVVWGLKGCAVFWDESSDSLEKHAPNHKKMFTRIRHEHKAFYLLGHDFSVMTPLMRGNLSEAYIFRQSETRAKDWCELFADRDLLDVSTLERREFILKKPFEKCRRMKPTLAELDGL